MKLFLTNLIIAALGVTSFAAEPIQICHSNAKAVAFSLTNLDLTGGQKEKLFHEHVLSTANEIYVCIAQGKSISTFEARFATYTNAKIFEMKSIRLSQLKYKTMGGKSDLKDQIVDYFDLEQEALYLNYIENNLTIARAVKYKD